MPAPTICTISGNVSDLTDSSITGVTIEATTVRPYIDPTSGSLIPNSSISTQTDVNGDWTMSLIETTTANVGVKFTFYYILGANNAPAMYEYIVLVPNAASANFSTLVTGQT